MSRQKVLSIFASPCSVQNVRSAILQCLCCAVLSSIVMLSNSNSTFLVQRLTTGFICALRTVLGRVVRRWRTVKAAALVSFTALKECRCTTIRARHIKGRPHFVCRPPRCSCFFFFFLSLAALDTSRASTGVGARCLRCTSLLGLSPRVVDTEPQPLSHPSTLTAAQRGRRRDKNSVVGGPFSSPPPASVWPAHTQSSCRGAWQPCATCELSATPRLIFC